eukprot:287918_1
MGTDSSKTAPDVPAPTSAKQPEPLDHDYKEESKEMERKIQEEVQKKMAAGDEKFQEKLKEVEESIKNDKSVPNLVNSYAELRKLMPPNVHALGDFVGKMKEGWAGIMAQLDPIRKYGGTKGVETANMMEQIHLDYWELLLKTRSKIQIIMTRCKIQKRNINDLLEILVEGHDPKHTPSADDRLAYQDCLNCLSMWLHSDNVQGIMEEWKAMNKRLLAAKQEWPALMKAIGKHMAKQSVKYTWKCIGLVIAGTLVAIAVIAAVTVAIVATGGAAAPVAAGAAVAIAEATAISSSVAIGTALAVGACVVVGGVAYAGTKAYNYYKHTAALHNQGLEMTDRLAALLKHGKQMQNKLAAVDAQNQATSAQLDYMKDLKSFQKMESALKELEVYLDEYITQCKAVNGTIQEAAEEFINV